MSRSERKKTYFRVERFRGGRILLLCRIPTEHCNVALLMRQWVAILVVFCRVDVLVSHVCRLLGRCHTSRRHLRRSCATSRAASELFVVFCNRSESADRGQFINGLIGIVLANLSQWFTVFVEFEIGFHVWRQPLFNTLVENLFWGFVKEQVARVVAWEMRKVTL